jgi:hypothetical protein
LSSKTEEDGLTCRNALARKIMPQDNRISCQECRFYYITWDPKAPYGCRTLHFKSPWLPSKVVFQSSGSQCLHYKQKQGIPLKKAKKE